MILIVSHPRDDHARAVCDVLDAMGAEVELFDLADYPRRASLAFDYAPGAPPRFVLRRAGRAADLTRCGAAWWRRPQPFELGDDVTEPGERAFAYAECHEAVTGLWHALGAAWVNDPGRDEVASKKSFQLRVAAEAGLRVPSTLISNDPDAARAFVARTGAGRTVYKSFLATEQHWRETRVLRDDEVDLLDHLAVAPVIFQEFVPADVDLRVTVVGDEIFPAAIHSTRTRYPVDFRMELDEVGMEPAALPADVEAALRRLMVRLGLRYGAIDLRRTPEGAHVFFEVNPSGEWLFVAEKTGQPITRAVAELLAGLDGHGGAHGGAH